MYVCLCHGVTDRAIREAVDRGVTTLKELSLSTGCATQCGSCSGMAREILEKAKQERATIALPVVLNPVAIA